MIRVHLTKEVFVAGSVPRETYNPRQSRNIEESLERFLEDQGKALTVYGSSKSGKTSLVDRMAPEGSCPWIQGQDIGSVDDFWRQLASRLGLSISVTNTMA